MSKINLKEDWLALLIASILTAVIIISWIPPYDFDNVFFTLIRAFSFIGFLAGSVIYLFFWILKKSKNNHV